MPLRYIARRSLRRYRVPISGTPGGRSIGLNVVGDLGAASWRPVWHAAGAGAELGTDPVDPREHGDVAVRSRVPAGFSERFGRPAEGEDRPDLTRSVMWDHPRGRWPADRGCGSMVAMLAAVVRRFVARRHVDYGRVRSAICPAH